MYPLNRFSINILRHFELDYNKIHRYVARVSVEIEGCGYSQRSRTSSADSTASRSTKLCQAIVRISRFISVIYNFG